MISDTQIDELTFKLFMYHQAEVVVEGSPFLVKFSEDMRFLTISTSVFKDSYIPHSVKQAVKAKALFPQSLATYFKINDAKNEVTINFEKDIDQSGFRDFEEWLKEFVWLADEWREVLLRYGREDLVFVYVSKN